MKSEPQHSIVYQTLWFTLIMSFFIFGFVLRTQQGAATAEIQALQLHPLQIVAAALLLLAFILRKTLVKMTIKSLKSKGDKLEPLQVLAPARIVSWSLTEAALIVGGLIPATITNNANYFYSPLMVCTLAMIFLRPTKSEEDEISKNALGPYKL